MKYLIFIVFMLPFGAYAQQDVIFNHILKDCEEYSNRTYHEKIYLHVNKSIYLSGETVWFKVYNLEATTHKKSALSKFVYVEIIDHDGKPFMQEIVELSDGFGSGNISIPNTMSSDNYYIRAYTNWMKNYDETLFFTKSLKIINPFKRRSLDNPNSNKNWDVQFFPEGGNLVTGVVNTIGIKGIDGYGKGFDFSGKVVDSKDNLISTFESLKFGIGSFQFKPEVNESYRSIIMLPDSTNLISELPKHVPGISVMVTETEDHFNINILRNGLDFQDRGVNLLLQCQGVVNLQVSTHLKPEKDSINIEKDHLKDGVNKITLFDGDGLPICERLVYKRPEHLLVIESEENKLEHGPRSKVKVNLNVTSQNNPTASNLSISVFRSGDLGSFEYYNIVSELLLSSELVGHIEHLEYYMNGTDHLMSKVLDNLMLTQGWRRYTWKDVRNKEEMKFDFIPEYQGFTISGNITDTKSNDPIENMFSYLTIIGNSNQTLISRSKSDGKVIFEAFDFYGHNDIITSVDSDSNENVKISLDNPFDTRTVTYPLRSWELQESSQEEVIKSSISMQVENNHPPPVISTTTKPGLESFYSNYSEILRLDDYTRFPTMLETLQENAKGVQVKKNQDGYYIKLFDVKEREMINGTPFVILDGVPVKDFNKIMQIPPKSIEQIDIVFSDYIISNRLMNGLVSFSSFDESNIKTISSAASIMSYQGPQLSKEFYTPKYDTGESRRNRIPDFRNALYWNPYANSNEKGICSFEFYTSDLSGEYIIRIEGIDENGNPGSKELQLKVVGENTF